MICKKCGAQIPDNSVFCPDCGAKAAAEAAQEEESAVDKITQNEESAIDETPEIEKSVQESLISEEPLSEHEQEQVKEQPKKKKNKKLMIGISAAAILLIFVIVILAHAVSKGSLSEAANNQTTTEQTEKDTDTDTETETTNTNEYGHETYSDDVAEARLAELDENANLDNLTISQQIENFNAIAEDLTDDQLVNYLEIKSDGYLSEDELGSLFVDRMNKWINAGAYDDLYEFAVDVNESWDEYLPKVAEKNSQFYVEALTDSTSEYSDSGSLNNIIAIATEANRRTLTSFVATAWNSKDHPENIQPYSDWFEIQDTELVNGGGESDYIEIKLTTIEDSNGGIENNQAASDNPVGVWYIKAVRSDDGSYKFVDIDYSS